MRCVPKNVVLLAILSMCDATATFCPTASCGRRLQSPSPGLFMAKKLKKKGGRKKAAVSGGLKGFGSSTPKSATSSGAAGAAKIDRSKPSLAFYDYLEKNGAGDNLKRVALAHFPIGDFDLRGVVALRDIKKGDPIIDVPYELAINLGRESSDPTLPAVTLLQEYCRWKVGAPSKRVRDDGLYFQMLPSYMGSDCLGSTDFFSDEAMNALQCPPIKDETFRRREQTVARFERDVEPMTQISDNMYRWKEDGTAVDETHLRWAAWLVTSRVLTVQGEGGSSTTYRLMIPLIDMCNHDRSSPHVLTGRAAPGGRLRILAGRNVNAGEQINICYGGGVAGNDRFIQDYGFLDTFDDGTAFDMVAKMLTGTGGRAGFGGGGHGSMSNSDKAATLEAMQATTLEEDEAALDAAKEGDIRAALAFRIGMKKALERTKSGVGQ